ARAEPPTRTEPPARTETTAPAAAPAAANGPAATTGAGSGAREAIAAPVDREPAAAPDGPGATDGAAGRPSGAAPALTTEELRRRWPEVLENLRASPVTWSLVSANAQVSELGPDVLYLAFPSPGLARTFSSSRHTSAVQDVAYQTLGLQVRVEPQPDDRGAPGGGRPAPSPAPGSPAASRPGGPAPAPAGPAPSAPGESRPAAAGPGDGVPLATVGAPGAGPGTASAPTARAATAPRGAV